MRTLARIIWVPLAFLVAALATAFMLFTLGSERITQAMAGRGLPEDTLPAMIELAGEAVRLASALTIVPALVVIVVGEVARIRGWLYYVLGAGAALVAVPLVAKLGQAGPLTLPAVPVMQVFATAGFVGGFVYWLLAGRNA
ncbi:MAG: hypothetical protein R3D27_14790 [Hyphomicrobiaceae bacterium]